MEIPKNGAQDPGPKGDRLSEFDVGGLLNTVMNRKIVIATLAALFGVLSVVHAKDSDGAGDVASEPAKEEAKAPEATTANGSEDPALSPEDDALIQEIMEALQGNDEGKLTELLSKFQAKYPDLDLSGSEEDSEAKGEESDEKEEAEDPKIEL